jgi:hypothetical protein
VPRFLLLLLALAGGTRDAAADPGRVGVMLDAGVPDGGHASTMGGWTTPGVVVVALASFVCLRHHLGGGEIDRPSL